MGLNLALFSVFISPQPRYEFWLACESEVQEYGCGVSKITGVMGELAQLARARSIDSRDRAMNPGHGHNI